MWLGGWRECVSELVGLVGRAVCWFGLCVFVCVLVGVSVCVCVCVCVLLLLCVSSLVSE